MPAVSRGPLRDLPADVTETGNRARQNSLRSKRFSNVGSKVLGNAEGARSTRLSNIGSEVLGNAEGARSVKLALLVFPYFYTARPKLHKRLLRRLTT